MTRLFFIAACLCAAVSAQTFPEPPLLIRVIRGTLPDSGAAARYGGAGLPAVFAMSSITGGPETWWMETHGSFGSIEQADLALRPLGSVPQPGPNDMLPGPLSWVAVYRPWLSYRPNEAVQMLGKTRYFQTLIFRVDPEHNADFIEAVRARKVSLDAINLDRPEMAYQIISGAPTITYVFFAPLASLKSLDEALARTPPYARPAQRAAAAADISHQNLLLRLEPSMSLVPDDIAEADPGFWRGKPQQ